MTTNNSSDRGFGYRFGRALGRFLLALLKTIVFVLIIAGIAAALIASYNLFVRGDRNEQWVDLLVEDIDTSRQRENELQADLDIAQDQIATLQADMAVMEADNAQEMSTMSAIMHDMDDQLSILARSGQTVSETVAILDTDLAGLQAEMDSQTATLGEDVTGLQTDTDGLRDDLTTLQTQVDEIPEVDVVRLEELLLLFRVGEMISRARLHLAEGNGGLALEQVNVALALVNGMIADERFDAAAITPLQERLRLAQSSLPTDSALASRDLETAWSTLDIRLTDLLGLVLPANSSAVLEATATAIPTTPTATPQAATATPLPVTITATPFVPTATPAGTTPTVPLPTFTPTVTPTP